MSTMQAPAAAAEIAHAMSECMNLLFFFAAPRVFAQVRGSDAGVLDRDLAVESLRRFLKNASGIRSRAAAVTGDVARLVQAAALVEEIAGALPLARFDEPLPEGIVSPARRALAALGFSEPKGGWDEFDGFNVPYPASPDALKN